MRSPNTACLVCSKPLYRRPGELKRFKFVACFSHRGAALREAGLSISQQSALDIGRRPQLIPRARKPHTEETKRKIKESGRRFYMRHPDVAKARGKRAEKHYSWKGGVTKLNKSIRRMDEYRKWAKSVKERDGFACVICRSEKSLESHHLIELSEIIEINGIRNRDDARNIGDLWDVRKGTTLCRKCHYVAHGRKEKCN